MHSATTTPNFHQASPAILRAAVLGRRIKASPAVAALIGELAFGQVDRDRVTTTPVLMIEVR